MSFEFHFCRNLCCIHFFMWCNIDLCKYLSSCFDIWIHSEKQKRLIVYLEEMKSSLQVFNYVCMVGAKQLCNVAVKFQMIINNRLPCSSSCNCRTIPETFGTPRFSIKIALHVKCPPAPHNSPIVHWCNLNDLLTMGLQWLLQLAIPNWGSFAHLILA